MKTLTLFIHLRYRSGGEDRIRFEGENILKLFDRVGIWILALTSKDDYIITNYPISKKPVDYDLIED